jgi:predicted PurR-regulated permease PerM
VKEGMTSNGPKQLSPYFFIAFVFLIIFFQWPPTVSLLLGIALTTILNNPVQQHSKRITSILLQASIEGWDLE